MALATQCPHCQTIFRVAHDQLKLRAGLVRCGACKQIFNGIENLSRPDQPAPDQIPPDTVPPVADPVPAENVIAAAAATPFPSIDTSGVAAAPPAVSAPSAPIESAVFSETITATIDFVGIDNQVEIEPPASAAESSALPHVDEPVAGYADVAEDDPLQRMTLVDFRSVDAATEPEIDDTAPDKAAATDTPSELDSAAEMPDSTALQTPQAYANIPDPLDQAIEKLQQQPWRGGSIKIATNTFTEEPELDLESSHAEIEEPSFVTQGRRRQRRARGLKIVMSFASILLLLGLLAQSAYVFRSQLAAWFPQTKPELALACRYLGCQVKLLSQIDAVSIESSELQIQAPDKNTFALTLLLRNQSATAQAWPNVELTLNDNNEKALARRVLVPRDYLVPGQDIAKGFAANAEQPVKISFELAQLKASGYRVYLFYP